MSSKPLPPTPPAKKPLPPTPGTGAAASAAPASPSSAADDVPAAAAAAAAAAGDVDPDPDAEYRVAKKVDLQTQLALDKDDESLNRWKASLLGRVDTGPASDPRQVIIQTFAICVPGRPDIVIPLATPEDVAAAKQLRLVLKEGAAYRTRITFRVQHDIVMGLKWTNEVKRLGFSKKTDTMLGSYGPQAASHVWTSEENEVPSGMFARGEYTARCLFVDDDKNVHCDFKYHFSIEKDWAA